MDATWGGREVESVARVDAELVQGLTGENDPEEVSDLHDFNRNGQSAIVDRMQARSSLLRRSCLQGPDLRGPSHRQERGGDRDRECGDGRSS